MTALEFGGQKGSNNIRYRLGCVFCPQAENVGVVVLPCPTGAEDIVAQGGSDAGDLVCCHGHTDAGAACQDTVSKISGSYRTGYFFGNVRIINRGGTIATEILTAVAGPGNQLNSRLFQVKASVVTADSNTQ